MNHNTHCQQHMTTKQANGISTEGTLRRDALPLLVLALTGAAICLFVAKPFFSALAWSVALAVALNPVYRFLLRKVHSANLAAASTVITLTLLLGGAATAVLPGLVQAGLDGVNAIQVQIEAGAPTQLLGHHQWLLSVWHWLSSRADLAQAAQQATGYFTALGSSLVQSSLIGLVEILLTLFFLFYLLRDQDALMKRLRSWLPLRHGEARKFFKWQVDTLYATLVGSVLVGIIQGLMGGLMFWWLGLKTPVFWGMVMGILCILPVVGPSLVWGPAALLLALGGHWGKAVVLVCWGAIVIGLIGNLIYPILLGRRLHLHTAAVFIAMLGGLLLFGPCGFFVGPGMLAATLSLLSIWRKRMGASSFKQSHRKCKSSVGFDCPSEEQSSAVVERYDVQRSPTRFL